VIVYREREKNNDLGPWGISVRLFFLYFYM